MSIPVFDKNNKLKYIDIDHIYSICREPKSRRIVISSVEGEFFFPSTLEQISYIMSDYEFAQIDKNKIVNLNLIKEYKNNQVTLDGKIYVVSRRRKKEFEKKLIDNRSHNTNG